MGAFITVDILRLYTHSNMLDVIEIVVIVLQSEQNLRTKIMFCIKPYILILLHPSVTVMYSWSDCSYFLEFRLISWCCLFFLSSSLPASPFAHVSFSSLSLLDTASLAVFTITHWLLFSSIIIDGLQSYTRHLSSK